MLITSAQGASANGISIWVPVIAAIVGAVAVIAAAVPNYFLQRRQLVEQREIFERQHGWWPPGGTAVGCAVRVGCTVG
jgi:hypothetical protein